MIVATMIAGIGVMLDQPILIVGAMVVGPEFGPLVALCIGIVTRRRHSATPHWAFWFRLCRRDGGECDLDVDLDRSRTSPRVNADSGAAIDQLHLEA
jgi:hypothetical protein